MRKKATKAVFHKVNGPFTIRFLNSLSHFKWGKKAVFHKVNGPFTIRFLKALSDLCYENNKQLCIPYCLPFWLEYICRGLLKSTSASTTSLRSSNIYYSSVVAGPRGPIQSPWWTNNCAPEEAPVNLLFIRGKLLCSRKRLMWSTREMRARSPATIRDDVVKDLRTPSIVRSRG